MKKQTCRHYNHKLRDLYFSVIDKGDNIIAAVKKGELTSCIYICVIQYL